MKDPPSTQMLHASPASPTTPTGVVVVDVAADESENSACAAVPATGDEAKPGRKRLIGKTAAAGEGAEGDAMVAIKVASHSISLSVPRGWCLRGPV